MSPLYIELRKRILYYIDLYPESNPVLRQLLQDLETANKLQWQVNALPDISETIERDTSNGEKEESKENGYNDEEGRRQQAEAPGHYRSFENYKAAFGDKGEAQGGNS